jgi:hypothetical protein
MLIFGLSISHAAVFGPKDVIFVIPTVTGDDFENKFDDEDKKLDLEDDIKDGLDDVVKETEDGYTITIPIKNDEGEHELVDVEYIEVDGTRTISIPGEGDISIIQDDDGNYNFELTPEQIKNADNVSCSVNTAGKSKCSIKPFVTMVGSKILTADELVLDYTEGENLAVVGGDAKNLKLTDEDSTTGFNKSVVDAGDTFNGIANVLNGMPFSTPKLRRPAKKRRSLAQELEIKRFNRVIDEIESRYNIARLLEKFDKALSGSFPFSDLTEDEFEALSALEISLGASSRTSTLSKLMVTAPIYTGSKASYNEKLDWLVVQTSEHTEQIDTFYKDKHSIEIYGEYLDNFNKLRNLDYTGRSIR